MRKRCFKVVAGWAAVSAACSAVAADHPGRPPNVVFILADDMGWMDTSYAGNKFWDTPNLDALVRRGAVFTEAHAASPICAPSRSAIMSGMYPARTGVTKPVCQYIESVTQKKPLREVGPQNCPAIEPESLTRLTAAYPLMSETFKKAGYATGHFGKWHLGWTPYDPLSRGFDEYLPGGELHDRYFAPWNWVTEEPDPSGPLATSGRNRVRADLFTGPAGQHIDDRMTDEAIGFITKHKEQPFFVNLWLFSPHSPIQATEEETAAFMKKINPLNPEFHPVYAAMITRLDRNVGRIVETLDRLGLARDTVLVFTSDNGGVTQFPAGGKVLPGLQATSNLPARGGKGNAYDGGTRVPMIMVWPGRIPAGTVCREPVSSIDYYPTLLDLCGLKPAPNQTFDGISLAPVFKGEPLDRDAIYSLWPHYADHYKGLPCAWVRQGDWKLMRFFADGPGQSDRFELYHLAEDIGESRDLSAQHPEKAAMLNQMIDGFLKRTEAVVPAPNPAYQPPWVGPEPQGINPVTFRFDAGSDSGPELLGGKWIRDGGLVIEGAGSLLADAREAAAEWVQILTFNPKALPVSPGTVYKVSFDIRWVDTASDTKPLAMFFRSSQGGVMMDRGAPRMFGGKPGEIRHEFLIAHIRDLEDYRLVISMRKGAAAVLDNITIAEVR